jgi:hypothetical protein
MFNKIVLLTLTICTGTFACCSKQEKQKTQISPLLLVTIEYKNTLEAKEIQKDIKAAFAKRMGCVRDNELSGKLLIYIDASEKEIREKLKNKTWSPQIKEIIKDREFSAD